MKNTSFQLIYYIRKSVCTSYRVYIYICTYLLVSMPCHFIFLSRKYHMYIHPHQQSIYLLHMTNTPGSIIVCQHTCGQSDNACIYIYGGICMYTCTDFVRLYGVCSAI